MTPFVCSEGDPLLLSPQRDEEMVLFAGTQEAGASTVKPHHSAQVGGFAGLKSRSC